MSKLLEKLRRATQHEAGRIGFGPAAAPPPRSPAIVLVALLTGDARALTPAIEAGADAVCLANASSEEISQLATMAGRAPIGLCLKADSAAEAARAQQAGGDFVVLQPEHEAAALRAELGRFVEVGLDWPVELLRTIDQVPVDGAMIADSTERLTVRDLLRIQRLATAIHKPILMRTAIVRGKDDLQTLRELGIEGVMLEIVDAAGAEAIRAYRQTIDGLPPTIKKQRRRLEAVLPSIQRETGRRPEIDEDDDEDDE